MSTIALCIIVKNEEKYLQGCFDSVKNVVDEIVLVDTGSTDKTLEIAKQNNAKIFHFEWQNDFSAARNFGLSKVTSDWVLYLDADERLDKDSINEIKRYITNNSNIAYFCNVVSHSEQDALPSSMKFLRFFRYDPKARFTGKVHEQIEPSLRALGYEFSDSNITIIHLGYNVDKEILLKKARRNLDLLLKDYEETGSIYDAFQIGQSYMMLEETEKSVPYFLKVIENPVLDENHLAQAYRYLAASEFHKGNLQQAEIYAKKGLEYVESSPLLHVLLSNVYLDMWQGEDKKGIISSHVIKAYNYNQELLEGKRTTKFDIFINEKNMLLYGINVALIISNKELFEFFFEKLSRVEIAEEDKMVMEFYHEIFSRGLIDKSTMENFEKIKNKIDINSLVKSFSYLNDFTIKESLSLLKPYFENDYMFNYAAGSRLIPKYPEISVKYFEKALELNPEDLMTFWYLFNIYLKQMNLPKLEMLLNVVKEHHSENSELKNKLQGIIDKLKKASNERGG